MTVKHVLTVSLLLLSLLPTHHRTVAQSQEPAKVFVYMLGHAKTLGRFSAKVFVDNKRVAEINKNRYFLLRLPPGNHEFYIKEKKLGGVQFTVEPGETYYLKVNIDEGTYFMRFRGLSIIPKEEGEFTVKQLQPIKKNDIFDKSLVDQTVVSK